MNKFQHPDLSESKLINVILSLFFLSCLFPFVSPVPIETDTQPIFAVLAFVIFFYFSIYSTYNKNDCMLLFLSLASLIYINVNMSYVVDVGKAISIVVGVLTLLAYERFHVDKAYALIKGASLIYFVFSCLIYFDSGFFLDIQKYLVRAINVDDVNNLSYRGVPTLSTEPGLLGGLLVFLLMELRYLGDKIKVSANELNLYSVLIIATILMTKSGTGYLYLILYLAFYFYSRISRAVIVLSILLVTFLGMIVFGAIFSLFEDLEIDNRGLQIVFNLILNGGLDGDTSALKRIYDIWIGVVSIFEHPFGVGVNGVNYAVNDLAIKYSLLRDNDIPGAISLVSGLSHYFVAYGLLAVLFLIYLFFLRSRSPILHKFFALIFLSASYSPAFPAIWLLLSKGPVGVSKLNLGRH